MSRRSRQIDWKKILGHEPDMNWAAHARPGAMSALERQHKHRESSREISGDFAKAVEKVDWERRRRCLADPRQFIREYCMESAALFDYEPFAETDEIIEIMLLAVLSDVPYHIRITRGGGKTTLFAFLFAFLICRNDEDFIVYSAAKMAQAVPVIEDVAALFTSSEKLIQDFPEKCLPLVMLGGSMQRATSQRFLGTPTNCRLTRGFVRFPTLSTGCPLLKGSEGGAILMANGFEGKTRGLRIGKRRPTLVALDDIGDEVMAANPEQVEKARSKIYKTYMKLGKSIARPAIVMASTPIEPDDLSETIAADPNWKTVTFPLMLSLPNDLKLWKGEYQRIRQKAVDELSGHPETDFYLAHRDEMDAGASPFWAECYSHDGSEASAVQHAMNLFLDDEASFLSEYQMKPRRKSAELILPRTEIPRKIYPGYVEGAIPDGYVYTVAATDINPSYALTTTVVAFKPDRSAFVAKHVISPITIDVASASFDDHVFSALALHGEALRALGLPIRAWGIDASGQQFSAVTAFAKSAPKTVRMPAVAMMGRANTRFNPYVRSRTRDAVNNTVDCADDLERAAMTQGKVGIGSRWILWNADVYKEAVQRALLAPQLAPRGCTVYADGDHTDFAIQVCNEILRGKKPSGDGRDQYDWDSHDPHDFLDTMAMCYALAGRAGISGAVASRPIMVRKRRKVIIR